MFKAYVIYSKKFDKIYIGYSSNLEQRLLSHNKLATKGYTIRYRPWELVYTEEFETKTQVLKRDKQLKSARGRVFIRETIAKIRNEPNKTSIRLIYYVYLSRIVKLFGS